jgi:quercetin dioxygenase-like cupin family protein
MPLWHDSPGAWHEILPGVRRRILAHGSSAMMVLYRIEPGRVFPRHTHPHAQYGTVLEGGGTFRVAEQSWTLRPGDAYFVPPDVPHELLSDPSTSTVILDVFAPRRDDFLNETVPSDAP